MRVQPASIDDLPAIHAAYERGRAIERAQGVAPWPPFSDAALVAEMEAQGLFSVFDGPTFAGVFSIADADPIIWGARERGEHVYLHRIARSPDWTGRGLTEAALAWAEERCRALGRIGVRLDTWADNAAIIAHYVRLGFTPVDQCTLPADPRLSVHYHGLTLLLLERPCAGR